MSDGYRPGRIVTKRGDEVYLSCDRGHEFTVTLLGREAAREDIEVKHCPFCGSVKLDEI